MSTRAQQRSLAVVIPTYDRADRVVRAVESVLAQSRPPDELIVVDDGSTDDTADRLQSLGHGLTYVRQENAGASSARNRGVAAARSEFVAFLDSDDVWDPGHLERMEHAIAATNAAAGHYFADLVLAPGRGGATAWRQAGFSIDGTHEVRPPDASWAFLAVQPMTIQASVVRRETYLAVGGCDERLPTREDTLLFFHLGFAAPACAVRGEAGLLTDDDARSLSSAFSPRHAVYVDCTIRLYESVRESYGSRMTSEQRRVAARRLANAYWWRAREAGARSPGRALAQLGRATRVDPFQVPRRIVRRAAGAVRRRRSPARASSVRTSPLERPE